MGTNRLDRAEQLRHFIAFSGEISAIAAGQNTLANLLDMVTVVTLVRMAVEHQYVAQAYGASALPLLRVCREAETNIWQIAAPVLSPQYAEELRAAIQSHFQAEFMPSSVIYMRVTAFAPLPGQGRKGRSERDQASSVFSLLQVDPLAGLAPAAREVAETRLFAERAMFLAQRMPHILRWQTELWAHHAVEIPEVQLVLTNATRLSLAADRLSRTVEQLPDRIAKEREAILAAVQSEQQGLTTLASEVRQSLENGARMASNLTTTLQAFDGVVERLDSGPPNTNAEPFRIGDYARSAAQVEASAQRLTELLHTFDQTLGSTNLERLTAQVGTALQQAQASSADVVDYAFRKALVLIVLGCVIALAAGLVYQLVVHRLIKRSRSSPPS